MAQTYATGKEGTLSADLTTVATTLTATVDAGISAGRIRILESATKEEWVSFTGKSANGSNFDYTGLTRGLSQTADPATAGTGLKFEAGTQIEFVAMHDQLVDKQEDTTFKGNLTVLETTIPGIQLQSLTTTERDATSPVNGHIIYNETDGEGNIRQGGAWVALASGSTQPNATTTVAGKVEIATSAESIAGTDTGGTGASVTALPSDIATNIQTGTFIYQGTETGAADAYAISLTPNLVAYAEGMKVTFTAVNANTGASTINIDSLGTQDIKLRDGSDPTSGDIGASEVVTLTYDGTNFIMEQEVPASTTRRGSVELLTDAEAITGTDTTRYANIVQIRDKIFKTVFIPFGSMLEGAADTPTTNSRGWQFTAAASEFVVMDFFINGPYTSISSVTIHTIPRTTNSGNVEISTQFERWRVATARQTDSLTETITYTATVDERLDFTIGAAAFNTITTQADDLVSIFFNRIGSDGNDTYTGVMSLTGITVVLST